MKTLDEVIKALEYCTGFDFVRCQDCPGYSEPDCGIQDNALHYLKEYQGLSKMWNDKLDKEQENQPLDWDELRTMEGKPVWVEHKHYSKWLIVYEVYEHTIVLDGNGFYVQYFYDDNEKEIRWQAYRKENV